MVKSPWSTPADEILTALGATSKGLGSAAAAQALIEVGPNRLAPPPRPPLWKRILSHFADPLIYILLAAGALKAVIGDWIDFSVIIAVAVINAMIGFIQESRAQAALDAIKDMLSVGARVLRDGELVEVDAAELVPGDVVRVRSGDRIPADMRILEAVNLQVEESALTGESVPAFKQSEPVAADAGIGDRASMLYSGTLVAAGTGCGVVVGTAADTEIGRIQKMMSEVESNDTPLSLAMARFGKFLGIAIVAISVLMFLIGLMHGTGGDTGRTLGDNVSAAIAFAVATIPEGLPALVTITLALGVQQMARRKAITRRLPAVETLGSVSTICSDKTGTLTRNEMTARMVQTSAAQYEVSGLGYAPQGEVTLEGAPVTVAQRPDLAALAQAMALCNDARTVEEGGQWRLVGEPTEGALAVLAPKAGQTTEGWTRLAVVPFESSTKYMATLDESSTGERVVHVKGAPDRVLARCTRQVAANGGFEPIDTAFWERQIDEIGSRGLRVLSAAQREAPAKNELGHGDIETDLAFAGLVGIVDPPRPEAVEAIATAHRAGVSVKMITGDHAGTALAIAREMGIVTDEADPASHVLTGAELEEMDDARLADVVRDVDVYARTSPEHKIRIVSALQKHQEVVAMTGDGVNDAPALTQADVGVAMGIKGTEATKEAADVVLADDNFATIERAVEEGRRIYDNIRKSILFLLPTNGAQGLVLLVAVLLGPAVMSQLPIRPVQALWLNMITGITLALPLATEAAEPGIMGRPPRDARASILDGPFLRRIALVSLIIGGVTLGIFIWEYEVLGGSAMASDLTVRKAQTTAVTMLAFAQLAYLLNCRFLTRSSLTPRVVLGNRMLWWSALFLLVLQLAFIYLPILQAWFHSAPIGLREWTLVLALSVLVFLLVEAAKAFSRSRERKNQKGAGADLTD